MVRLAWAHPTAEGMFGLPWARSTASWLRLRSVSEAHPMTEYLAGLATGLVGMGLLWLRQYNYHRNCCEMFKRRIR